MQMSSSTPDHGVALAEQSSIDRMDVSSTTPGADRLKGFDKVKSQPENVSGSHKMIEKGGEDTDHGGLRYWTVIFTLSMTGLLPALESTVLSTSLPVIVNQLGGDQLFVWAANAYFVSSTAVTPLYSQLADIWGRRRLILAAVCLFLLGSGLAGGANSMAMLIVGRAIQGTGGGGISLLINLIVCDLTPLRQRGSVLAIIFASVTIGTALGPVLGGVVIKNGSWRWAFYLNLPIGAVSLILLLGLLRVNQIQYFTLKAKMARIDFGGVVLFMLSTVSVILGLINGGVQHAWSSYQIILPLVLGTLGFFCFMTYESFVAKDPIIPSSMFSTNRTTTVAFLLTFLHTLLMYLEIYFLPLYFQATLRTSALGAGTRMLPSVILFMVFAGIGGRLMQRLGAFQALHAAGFALATLALALFTTLDRDSHAVAWIMFQIVFAAGIGIPMGTFLPAAQASLPDSATAAVTGTWATMRNFGTIFAVTVAAAIFDNRAAQLSAKYLDAGNNSSSSLLADQSLSAGQAYEHATADFIRGFNAQPEIQSEVLSVFEGSLRLIWAVASGLAGLGLVLVALERRILLRATKVETEFGLEKK